MGESRLPAHHSDRSVARAVARGVGDAGLVGLHHELELASRAPHVLPVAPRVGAELVVAEEEREAHLGHLDGPELEAPRRVPLAGVVPAVAAGGSTRARPRMEHVPDEVASRARIPPLEGNPKPLAPRRHRLLRAGGSESGDHRLDDLLPAVGGRHGDRRPVFGPHDRAPLRDDLDRPHGPVVLRDLGVEEVGEGHHHRGSGVRPRGVEEASDLGVGVGEVHPEIASRDGRRRADGDVRVAAPVVVEERRPLVGAVLPPGDDRPRLGLHGVEDPVGGVRDRVRPQLVDELEEAALPETHRADLGREVPQEVAGVADIDLEHPHDVLAELAPVVEAKRGDPEALLPDLGGGRVVGSVGGPADVRVVGAVQGPEQEPIACEHRQTGGQIREVAPPVVGIVQQEHVARVDVVAERLQGREGVVDLAVDVAGQRR